MIPRFDQYIKIWSIAYAIINEVANRAYDQQEHMCS